MKACFISITHTRNDGRIFDKKTDFEVTISIDGTLLGGGYSNNCDDALAQALQRTEVQLIGTDVAEHKGEQFRVIRQRRMSELEYQRLIGK